MQAIKLSEFKADAVDPFSASQPTESTGDVAIIPLIGVLTKQPTWADEYFGLCPAYGVIEQIDAALANENVKTIVLDIDSPGGFVNGSVELADRVAAANESKPVIAVVRGLCCSGAYWIASQCEKIVARPESEVGNIGVYSVLTDFSKFYSDIGIDLTLIASGQYKGLGADGKVTENYVSDSRRIISGLYQQFVNAVAKGRDMSPEDAQAVSDGKAYLGQQALKLGLIDEVASSFDAAISSATQKSASTARNSTKPMSTKIEKTDETTGTSADDLKAEMQSTISSANDHKTQARKMLDAYTAKSDEMDDDTKALAGQTVTALRAASEEAERCADAIDGDPDNDDDGDEEDDGDEGSAKHSFKATDYMATFGDIGARWFIEKKPFAVAASEYIASIKAEHKAQVDTLTAERDSLKQKLESMDRGNEAASFSVNSTEQAAKANQKLNGLTPGVSAFANSIKLPTAPVANLPTK